ncbi:MAG: PP2C family protein-serine/threonine phosphatase [Aeromicrobium sp.]
MIDRAAGASPGIAAESFPGAARFLRRVRKDMEADTATLLLIDSTRTVLEVSGTVGLDRTLMGARHVPIGAGFAGRVAQSRQPVVLADVTPSRVVNPVLIDHGLQTLLGVPVIQDSELLGVLHAGYLRERDITNADKRKLTELARELADSLREGIERAEQTAALTLQRSLLPGALTVPPEFAMAARYVPASGDLGGDWYDVFPLPDDRLVVVMGDVAGHGLESAIVMGRLRSALRAYALDADNPADVLSRLDREVCHFEPDVLATVVLGITEPPYLEWSFSSAGHFPPLVGAVGRPAQRITMPTDRVIGVDFHTQRHTTTVDIAPGGYFCLFTDGLVERRHPAADSDVIEENIAKVSEALSEFDDPEMGCISVLTEVVGDRDAEDDIAILIAQRLDA